MPSLFDTAKIQDNRPGPVDVGNGKTYCGPVWKDGDGFFVLFANARVSVDFDRSDRQWKYIPAFQLANDAPRHKPATFAT